MNESWDIAGHHLDNYYHRVETTHNQNIFNDRIHLLKEPVVT